MLLGRLAISVRAQGLGLGRDLVADALRSARIGAGVLGARALVAEAVDETAEQFHTHLGFWQIQHPPRPVRDQAHTLTSRSLCGSCRRLDLLGMRVVARLLPPSRGRRARRVLAGGVLSVVLLLGLLVMHAIGLHGSAGGHVLPAAHHAGVMTAEHHPVAPTTEVVADVQPVVTVRSAEGGASAAVVACVAILLLTALLSLPQIRLPRGWAPLGAPGRCSLRVPVSARRPVPLFQALCISRT